EAREVYAASTSMRKSQFIGLMTAGLLLKQVASVWAEAPHETLFLDKIEPILIDSCYGCHGDGSRQGDFAMDEFESLDDQLGDIDVWYEIWKNIRANLMPPADKPQLAAAEKEDVLRFIEDHVFKIDRENPDPGRVTMRRLNREEYRFTVKDVLAVDFDSQNFFPPDDTGYGFDTIGDVLSISPLLMEKYLEAAETVAAKAVPVDGPEIVTWWMNLGTFKSTRSEKHHLGYVPFDEERRFEGERWIDHDGEHEVSVHFRIGGSAEATEETGILRFGVDDRQLFERKVGWDNAREIVARGKAWLKEGDSHRFWLSMTPDQPRKDGQKRLFVDVESIRYRGPLDGSAKDYPWEFREIFSEGPPPDSQDERDTYRLKILTRLATQMFRRPVEPELIDRLVQLARAKDEQPGMKFEHGIRHAVTAMLVSPRFLMRKELQPDPDNPDRVETLDEYELASRLSYFLWLSAPDQTLLELAAAGQLRSQLREQIDRMLADQRSNRFIESFVGQWLQTRDVETIHIEARVAAQIRSSRDARREFNGRLRQAMRAETELLFAHVLREKRPATELLTAQYTFLNEDLAEWYGLKGIDGREMRRVDLAPDQARHRGGILQQASFHVVTSNPTRTSPVKRGLFVLENLLATPPPPAAPDVPPLEASLGDRGKPLTLREALAAHSEQKLCASCHARMDPIGLALENYNIGGAWQDEFRGKPIDTAGELITGETFTNAEELSMILAEAKQEEFFTALTEKLMTFALGRGVEFYDAPTIDHIVEQARQDGGQLKQIIYGLVESPAFQKRRGDGSLLE
ncbi:MAG: DUF1592 domain-containing protein, partial [Verrucomicrobiota bacterium]